MTTDPAPKLAAHTDENLDSSSVLWRLLRGAFGGACLAGFALGVGLLRAVYARLSGIEVSFDLEHVRVLAAYIAGFVVAGTLVSVLLPALRRKRSKRAVFALAGMIVAGAVVIGMKGLAVWTAPDWVAVLGLGPFFGLAVASGFLGR